MAELLSLKERDHISVEVGDKYREFGTFLLEDRDGAKVQAIQNRCHLDPLRINCEIMISWLQGEGRQPVTWATLIQVLRDIDMNALAEDIEERLCHHTATLGMLLQMYPPIYGESLTRFV